MEADVSYNKQRLHKQLMTISAAGPITALTRALEIGRRAALFFDPEGC